MKKILLIMASSIFAANANANLIVNGSFESNSFSGCSSNLSNASVSAGVAGVTAWGTPGEIDVYEGVCFGSNAPTDGTTKLHLHDRTADSDYDAFNFELTSSLIAGESYQLTFDMASVVTSFSNDIGTLYLGYSGTSTTFGDILYSATSSSLGTWETFTTTFVAGSGFDYLSVSSGSIGTNTDAWMAVDNFTLEKVTNNKVPEPATLALLGIGLAGLSFARKKS